MKQDHSARPFQLVHQIVSLTGINFHTRSIIGFVELTLLPARDNLKHVRLNAKQLRIYRVALDDVEAPFQYFDPTLEVCEGETTRFGLSIQRDLLQNVTNVRLLRDLETYSESHFQGCNLVDPDLNGGELNIRVPGRESLTAVPK